MPIHAFRCEACGHSFDRLQRLSDADPRECPECGKPALKRQVSAPSFRLAGSGWYETDFKSDKDKQRNLAGKGEPVKKNEVPSEGKSESPAPKAAETGGSQSSPPAAAPAASSGTSGD